VTLTPENATVYAAVDVGENNMGARERSSVLSTATASHRSAAMARRVDDARVCESVDDASKYVALPSSRGVIPTTDPARVTNLEVGWGGVRS
jgi:hypothetical protein